MLNLPRRHIEARRTERGLLGIVLFVIGAVLVGIVLIGEINIENPFSVIAGRVSAAVTRPMKGQ